VIRILRELKIETRRGVYEPAEDSHLLAKHAVACRGRVLEVGCGTGIVSLHCAAANPMNEVEGIDINPAAVQLARKNAEVNGIENAKFYESSFFSNTKGKYDWVLFNAPYLPTEEYEKVKGKVNFAFDGGKTGREVIEKFIELVPEHLNGGGGVLLVASSLSGIDEILRKFSGKGFAAKITDEQPLFFEKMYVISAFFNSFQTR